MLTREIIFEVSPKEWLRICEAGILILGTGNGMGQAWRFGRMGCVKGTTTSSVVEAEVECAGYARDGSGETGQGTRTSLDFARYRTGQDRVLLTP